MQHCARGGWGGRTIIRAQASPKHKPHDYPQRMPPLQPQPHPQCVTHTETHTQVSDTHVHVSTQAHSNISIMARARQHHTRGECFFCDSFTKRIFQILSRLSSNTLWRGLVYTFYIRAARATRGVFTSRPSARRRRAPARAHVSHVYLRISDSVVSLHSAQRRSHSRESAQGTGAWQGK